MDPILLQEFYRAWKGAPPGSKARGEVIRKAILSGYSRGSIHRKFNQLEAGENLLQVADGTKRRGKSRRSAAEIARDRKEILAIAGLLQVFNRDGRTISRETAARLAWQEGETSVLRDRHWVDRKLLEFGLTPQQMNREKRAVRWEAEYPMQCVMVDASPADQVFFNFKKKHFELHDVNWKDKHLDDHLEKNGLRKTFVYAAVELYSRAYFVRYYAPDPVSGKSRNGGENSEDWFDFLIRLFMAKQDVRIGQKLYTIPLFGVPEMVYSDRGSGLTSLSGFLLRIGSRLETHLPGNPRAKGAVERRIGAWKQQYERFLAREFVESLEDLRSWADQWMVHDNYIKGYYRKLVEGSRLKPIRTITEKNVHDATVGAQTRKVKKHHTIDFEGSEYLIEDSEILPGQTVLVYRTITGRINIQDQKTLRIIPVEQKGTGAVRVKPGSFQFQDGRKNLPETDFDLNRSQAIVEGSRIRRAMTLDSMRPPDIDPRRNIRLMPIQNTAPIKTHSSIPPEQFGSVESARLYLISETGLTDDLLPDDIRDRMYSVMDGMMETSGYISRDFVLDMRNALLEIGRVDRETGEIR